MTIATIGVDLAKNSLQLHGIDHTGSAVLRKKLSQSRFLEFFAHRPAPSGWRPAAARITRPVSAPGRGTPFG